MPRCCRLSAGLLRAEPERGARPRGAGWWRGAPPHGSSAPPRRALSGGAEQDPRRCCSCWGWRRRWSCPRAAVSAGSAALAAAGGELVSGRSAGLRVAVCAPPLPLQTLRGQRGGGATRAPTLPSVGTAGLLLSWQKPPVGGGKDPASLRSSPERGNLSHPSCSPGARSRALLGEGAAEGGDEGCTPPAWHSGWEGGRAWLCHSSTTRGSRRSTATFTSGETLPQISLLFICPCFSSGLCTVLLSSRCRTLAGALCAR